MATRVRPIPNADTAVVSKLISDPSQPNPSHVPVQVVKTTEGPVTFWQKVKGYYKGLIALIGTILAIAASPSFHFIDGMLPTEYQKWVAIGIAALTVALTFLKENEHWLDASAVTPAT